MPRWKPAPIIGGAYADDSRPWSHQDTVNYLVVPAEKEGTRSPAMLRGVPGMVLFTDMGTGLPIRGIHNVEGLLLVVSGNHLYKVSAQGAVSLIGTIPGVERVIMAHNQVAGGNQVAIANGQSGYVYDTRTNVVTQITDDGFPGAISFDFIDGYIVGIDPSRRYGFTSDLLDATSYSSLDRVSGESSPDKLVGQIVSHEQWWLFGSRTAEPFTNTGSAQGTFQRNSGGVVDVGAASRYAICQMDNAIVFLSEDGVVYRLNGYTPERISTHAIEQAISRCNKANAFGFIYKDRGHDVFYLTLPDGHTWGYDAASREWHRRQSQDMTRWRVSCLERWNDQWIAGDYANGKLYRLDWAVQNEDGGILERRRTTGVIADNQNSVILNGVALVFDTGVKTPSLLPGFITINGNLPVALPGTIATYQYVVEATYHPVIVTIASGALPTGLSMDSNGLVTGTYSTAGSYAWTVSVTDAKGTVASLAQSVTVPSGSVIALLHFNSDMTTDSTGRAWTVSPWTESLGHTPWLTWPQWDGTVYAAGPGSFRMSRAGTTASPEQGFYYGQARMYSALGVSGAIDGVTDFCAEGFVRRDPADDNGGGNTMFFDFGIQLWARQATPRKVSLEILPTGMIATYDPSVDLTVPTTSFIHFALTRSGSTVTLWWGGKAAATVSNGANLVLGSTFTVSLGTSQSDYYAWQMPGWLDEIRITKGWARYTQGFTPPSVPYS